KTPGAATCRVASGPIDKRLAGSLAGLRDSPGQDASLAGSGLERSVAGIATAVRLSSFAGAHPGVLASEFLPVAEFRSQRPGRLRPARRKGWRDGVRGLAEVANHEPGRGIVPLPVDAGAGAGASA